MNRLESMEHAAGMCLALSGDMGGLGSTEIELACEGLWMATVLALHKPDKTKPATYLKRVVTWASHVLTLIGRKRAEGDETWGMIYDQARDVKADADEELAEDKLIAEQDAEGEGS